MSKLKPFFKALLLAILVLCLYAGIAWFIEKYQVVGVFIFFGTITVVFLTVIFYLTFSNKEK